MSTFDPGKLSVAYRDGVAAAGPVIPRRYTLTHSDATGELFLTVGIHYAWDKVNAAMRDEVIGEWVSHGGYPYAHFYVHIDQGEYSAEQAARRNEIFRRELPLALTAIRYGDRLLFDAYPYLDQVAVVITFRSAYPLYARQERRGSFRDYIAG